MNAHAPALSVLMPVRNGEAHLRAALPALRRQTWQDYELCLQDDGSSDNTRALAQAAARRDPRVRLGSLPAQGLVAALRSAAARARGRLWVRMDADDLSHPERLQRLWQAAQAEPQADLFGSAVSYSPRARVTPGMRRYESWVNAMRTHADVWAARFTECPVVHGSWALRPALYARLGGYAHGPFPEDYDFLLRALDLGARVRVLPQPLLTVRLSAASHSVSDKRYSETAFQDLKLRHLVPWLGRQGRETWIVGAGPNGKAWARRLLRAGAELTGMIDPRPGRAGQRVVGLPVCLPEQTPSAGRAVLLLCVGTASTRARLAQMWTEQGRRAGDDWVRLH